MTSLVSRPMSVGLSKCIVNLSRTALKGAQIYETGKVNLDTAIREFDQVMMHLTARIVAGTIRNRKECAH